MIKLFERARRMKSLERLIAEIDVNLQNNYKSTAHSALARFSDAIARETADGILTLAQTAKYRAIAERYAEMMKNYHH